MEIKVLPLGALETNCYILKHENETLIIDPSGEADRIIDTVSKDSTVKAILLTHAHFDHIGALDRVASHFGVDTWIGIEEEDWLGDPSKNGSAKYSDMGIKEISSAISPEIIKPGSNQIGAFRFQALHTPGHSPGSMSFLFQDFIISGDVLFNGGIGRTDLYQADHETLIQSIRKKLYTQKGDLTVYPGHGPATTIGSEKQTNPFIRG
ncbi:MBL fold metallo-hydrolase [Salinicoccus hispanicus]|uniref:MBL fold metallo-hydrolase n=1 Tax=Salinicoccus hispanicus TaxID=157225 RepID=A0A6N8TW96_9STAP|nr:MBL fold metallo-hydrolase [Salinicoccus hispanicus]MXQ50198.1 MBL fold metallo-hydrolase [Salinicoccus hispanicus]